MEFFTVKDIAGLLSVNEETVRRWIREEKLKAERGSGRQGSKVSSEYLKEFLAENKNLTTTLAARTLGIEAIVGATAVLPVLGTIISPIAIAAIGKSWLSILKSKEKDKNEIKVELMEKELELENIAKQLKIEIASKQIELEQVEKEIFKLIKTIEDIEL